MKRLMLTSLDSSRQSVSRSVCLAWGCEGLCKKLVSDRRWVIIGSYQGNRDGWEPPRGERKRKEKGASPSEDNGAKRVSEKKSSKWPLTRASYHGRYHPMYGDWREEIELCSWTQLPSSSATWTKLYTKKSGEVVLLHDSRPRDTFLSSPYQLRGICIYL